MVNARGYTFIALNAVRALSIISLLLLFSSTVVTMADDIKAVNAFIAAGKSNDSGSSGNSTTLDCSVSDCDYISGSTVPNQPAGAFWAVLNSLLVIAQSIVCILSELSWPDRFFEAYFPVLGPSFGLGALGVIQCLLGAAVLSHHVSEFPLVSAFLVFSIGCLNIFLGLIFRERAKTKRSIKGWKEGNKDILPTTGKMPPYVLTLPQQQGPTPVHNTFYSSYDEKGASRSGSLSSQKAGYGFGRAGEKLAANQGYVVREPEESVPPYASKPASRFSHASSESDYPETREGHLDSSAHGHDEDDEEHEHASSPVTNSSATAF